MRQFDLVMSPCITVGHIVCESTLVVDHRDGWLVELTLDEGLEADVRLGLNSTTGRRASDKGILPIKLENYLELLDWTGRLLRSDKAGSIPSHLAHILDRLGIKRSIWQDLITNYHEWFG